MSAAAIEAGKANIAPYKWQPGMKSPNPSGRPKGTPNYSVVYARLSALSDEEIVNFRASSQAESIVLAQIGRARGLIFCKDPNAVAKEIADRVDGKAARQLADQEVSQRARVLFDLAKRAAEFLQSKVSESVRAIDTDGDVRAQLESLAASLAVTDEQILQSIVGAFDEEQLPVVLQALGVTD